MLNRITENLKAHMAHASLPALLRHINVFTLRDDVYNKEQPVGTQKHLMSYDHHNELCPLSLILFCSQTEGGINLL